jgi:3-hydroxymyristoyl/3-hydroxydecanoyl-(acyl carrier protein) dehydratase
VLLVEAAAQLAGTVAQSDPQIAPLPGLKLTALRAIKILGTAQPGETIRLEARVTGRMSRLVQADVCAYIADRLILQGVLTLGGDATAASSA